MKRIVWGVLSTAKIGTQKVIPGLQSGTRSVVFAIASRDPERARAAAAALNLPRAYGSYEELLADPSVDAIYNPLPNHLHVAWSIKALRAGKHVLCEKPIALTAREAEALIAARESSGKQILEGFMVRHHPQWQRARALVKAGRIGDLRAVQASFSYFNPDPFNIRNQADIGGGALYDIGCYAVLSGRFFFGTEPLRTISLFDIDPVMGIDRMASGLVEFPASRQLIFVCATQSMRYQKVHLLGTGGSIEIAVPFNPSPSQPGRLLVDDSAATNGDGPEVIETEPCDQYMSQGEEAARVFLGEIPPTYPIEDGVKNMRVLDALRHSAKSAQWCTV